VSFEQKIDLLFGDIFHFGLEMSKNLVATFVVESLHEFLIQGYLFLFKGEGSGTV
jgi:hypothetical protein